MDTVNSLPTERFSVLNQKAGPIDSGNPLNGDWTEVDDFRRLLVLFVINPTGDELGITLLLQSATDAAGTGVQTEMTFAAGSSLTNQVMMSSYNVDRQKGASNRRFYRARATGDTSNVANANLLLLGFDPHFSPASARNGAGVLVNTSST